MAMKRTIKPAVEITHPPRTQEPVREQVALETPPSHTHAPEHLLDAKSQQWHEQYKQLIAHSVWDAALATAACEKALADYCGVPHALLFCTESAAFQVLLEALSLSCYDRLYLPANLAPALYATASKTLASVHTLAIEPVNRRIDVTVLSSLLHKRTTRGRDVIVVSHAAGGAFPLYDVEQWICDPNTVVIEDATEALGAKEQSGSPIGSGYHTSATLLGFSPGSLLDVGGGGAITTRDPQLEKRLRALRQSGEMAGEVVSEEKECDKCDRQAAQDIGRFSLSVPQTALLHAQLQPSATSTTSTTPIGDLVKARQDLVKRYMAALQEAFVDVSKDCEPKLVESLSDPHAAPSALLLRIDCIQMEMRKERILHVFHKAGFAADFGSVWHDRQGHGRGHGREKVLHEEERSERPLSCFTSLRIDLQPHRTHVELVHLFRAFRDALMRS